MKVTPWTRSASFGLVFGLLGIVAVSAADVAVPRDQPVSAPSVLDPALLRSFGLSERDLMGAVATDRYRSRRSGVTHVYLRQTHDGLEVVNGTLGVHLDAHGDPFRIGDRWVREIASRIDRAPRSIAPAEAVRRAAREVGLPSAAELVELSSGDGPDRSTVFESPALSLEPIPVSLRYLALPSGSVRLVWEVRLRLPDGRHWWTLFVDSTDGRVLDRIDWIANDSYRVFAFPKENPYDGPRTLEVDPALVDASPFGWHDTDGAPGAEFTDTRGNNTEAQEDLDGHNGDGYRPDGGPGLDFDFPLDLDLPPIESLDASIVNLFYWVNLTHDITYIYGFDEAAGNFQRSNFGLGGREDDPVLADAQDGSSINTSRFGTPPDGFSGRLEAFIWRAPPSLIVLSPSSIAGEYRVGRADFGPELDDVGLTAEWELADDGSGEPTLGCEPLVGFSPGRVAVFDRGECEFSQKVLHAQEAGAVGAAVVNDQGDEVITMAPGQVGPQVTIPSVFLGQTDGEAIKAELDAGVEATMLKLLVDRDGAYSSGTIIHEYAHGVSIRATGGGNNVACLQHLEQMGEGISDFLQLALTVQPGDVGETPRTLANYLLFRDPDDPNAPGFRNYPYTTDFELNPLTYGDLPLLNIPHGIGEVWAAMLWDAYWRLVAEYGPGDLRTQPESGPGIAMQLVIDGLKLQPCSPTFVDARDAILDADLIHYGGANRCLLWRSFARRGLGLSADAGGGGHTDGTEAFDLPPDCEDLTGIDLSLTGTCPGSMTVAVTGVTPDAQAAIALAASPGNLTLPGGPCAGTELDLEPPLRARRVQTADGSGELSFDANAPVEACGGVMQVVDLESCEVSEVVQVP